jgi:hypothetical protein
VADDLQGLRRQAESLLNKAEATPAGPWTINDQEHVTMVKLAENFGLQLAVAAFRFRRRRPNSCASSSWRSAASGQGSRSCPS